MAKKTSSKATQLIEQLQRIRFFDGYTDKARKMAESKIVKSYNTSWTDAQRRFLERFPATATVSLTVYGEWDYEPFEPLVRSYADGSFGMFRPTQIKDKRDDKNNQMTLSFRAGGKLYSTTVEAQGWMPPEYMDLLEKAVKENCDGLEYHLIYESGLSDSPCFTFCKKRAYNALIKSKLVCIDYEIAISDEYQ